MILIDIGFVIRWWFNLFILGIIFLPLALKLTPKLKDLGYVVGKILSPVLIAFICFVGGSFKIFPFTNLTVFLTGFFILLVNLIIFLKNKNEFLCQLKTALPLIALEELLFFLTLVFWALIRGFNPEIQGLEKYMDFGFVNAILKTRFFPPADMWLAGETINYYYFGHLITAVLIKLSQIKPLIAYNLMVASLFAFSFIGSFSFGLNAGLFLQLKGKGRTILLGLLTAGLLTLSGNLHPLFFAVKNIGLKHYWYPDATRFIVEKFGAADNTIHEFPIYSFVVADLHGHLLNLPMVLVFLLIMVNITLGFNQAKRLEVTLLAKTGLAFLLAVFFITNTWDFAIYAIVFSSLIFFLLTQTQQQLINNLFKTAVFVLPIVAASLLLTIPFQLHFQNIAGGISLVDHRSPPWMLLVLWGLPLWLSLFFLKNLVAKKRFNLIDFFIVGLIIPAWFFILLPEVIYVKDIYIQSYQRANTVFKFTYQSFVLFSLTIPLLIGRILHLINRLTFRKLFLTITAVLMFFIFLYPVLAIKSFYQLTEYRQLAGDNYLQQYYPDNLQIINFLNRHQHLPVNIVEAVGESYTDYNQISSFTGNPTILGWRVHEWLWRGGFDIPAQRTAEVEKIYQSTDVAETKKLLDRYQVKYVVVGKLEYQKYPNLTEDKFTKLGKIVFETKQARLYQIETVVLPSQQTNNSPIDCQQLFQDDNNNPTGLSLLLVGDIMLARSVNAKTLQSNNFNWPFEKIADFLDSADITFANLESPFFDNCPVTNSGTRFCAEPKMANSLALNGVDIVSLANNHAGDFGQEAIKQTKELLQQKKILFTGSSEAANFNLKDRRIIFLGYNDIYPSVSGINWADQATIETEISQADKDNDLVIVSFHWGEEYTFTPTNRQRQLARLAIDAGADLIIGHHPHWVQPVEIYNNKLIFYSLGNFIFDQMWSQPTRQGLAALIIFNQNNQPQVKFYPILIENFGQPNLLSSQAKQTIIDKLEQNCRQIN